MTSAAVAGADTCGGCGCVADDAAIPPPAPAPPPPPPLPGMEEEESRGLPGTVFLKRGLIKKQKVVILYRYVYSSYLVQEDGRSLAKYRNSI